MDEFCEGKAFQQSFFSRNPELLAVFSLFDYLPNVYFFAKDRESRFVRMNAANLELYATQDESQLLGKTDRDFHPPMLAEAFVAEDHRAMMSTTTIVDKVWLVPYLDGRLQWFVCSKTPLLDAHREVIGIAGAMYPISTPEEELSRFKRVAPAVRHLDMHFEEPTPLGKIAEKYNLSLTQFNRLFRELLRISPSEYRTTLRVHRARKLLRYSKEGIASIAIDCGFSDHSHLTKHFKKATGLTPSAYRKACGG